MIQNGGVRGLFSEMSKPWESKDDPPNAIFPRGNKALLKDYEGIIHSWIY